MRYQGAEVLEFRALSDLQRWLAEHHTTHPGGWVRLSRAGSSRSSVTFAEVLAEGLAHGWSESTRHAFDSESYLQRFAPRRRRGTVSERNRRIVEELAREGRMTRAGWEALNTEPH